MPSDPTFKELVNEGQELRREFDAKTGGMRGPPGEGEVSTLRALLTEQQRAFVVGLGVRDTEIKQLRAELDEARRMLAECYVLSGADTDGNTPETGWVHLWAGAVEEVRQLREQYDEMNLSFAKVEQAAHELAAAVDRLTKAFG